MTRETVDQDTADQVMNSFKILAGEKVNENRDFCDLLVKGMMRTGRTDAHDLSSPSPIL